MRILVCGSRTYQYKRLMWALLDGLDDNDDSPYMVQQTIIEGGADGADTLARQWAESWGHVVEEYPADWDKHGKAAGPIRNRQMLDEGEPELVLAFIDKPLEESRGTQNMVDQALDRGLPVYVIQRAHP